MDRERVAAFLGEVCAVNFEDFHHPALPLARRDPRVMADAVRLAWLDWLRAECRQRPILLVLEDLHWGDAASVALVEAALKELSELPLVALGLARPEVHALFPRLWSGCRLVTLELAPISARAGETLARQALGPTTADGVIQSLVAQAEGNPFFLEELIRSAASGAVGQLPDTVLGVVQARLQALDPESRRLLRAASVFGGGFSAAAVATVLGEPIEPIFARIAALVQQEMLSSDSQTDAASYQFRHALLRDAAYAMLTDDDRTLAHHLAAEWLAAQQRYEPMAVAEHYLRAKMRVEAQGWFRRAAEQALEGGDFDAAVERAEQAIACGAAGELLAELRLVQSEARIWAGSIPDAERWATDAAQGLRTGSLRWFGAIQKTMYCASLRGDVDSALAWLAVARSAAPEPDARYGPLLCVCEATYAALVGGRADLVETLFQALEQQSDSPELSRLMMGHVQKARATLDVIAGRYDLAVTAVKAAAGHYDAVGDLRNAVYMLLLEGEVLFMAGSSLQAEQTLRNTQTLALRLGSERALLYCDCTLGEVLMRCTRYREARELFERVITRCAQRQDPRIEGCSFVALGLLELAEGHRDDAETRVRHGLSLLAGQSPMALWGLCALARVHLAGGRRDEAVALASRAVAAMNSKCEPYNEGFVWLTIVECLAEASGTWSTAQEDALGTALARLRRQLGCLTIPAMRSAFLDIPEWRALIDLARQHGGYS